MGHGQVPESGLPSLSPIRFSQYQEVRSDGHQLPEEHERHDVVGQRHEAQREQEQVQHRPERAQRRSVFVDARVGPAKQRGWHRHDLDDHKEEGAQAVQAEARAARQGEQLRHIQMEGRSPDQRVQPQNEPRAASHNRASGSDAPRTPTTRRDQGPGRAGAVAEHHDEEERQGRRHVYRGRGAGSRPRAAKMPLRMSAGSGGQPATKASTGTIWSTLPATA